MRIRDARADDWAQIHPFFTAIVAAGETYAYPEGLSSEQARELWMERPPGRTAVVVDGDDRDAVDAGDAGDGSDARVLGSAKMGPNRPGRGSHVATASFMVDPAAAGRGVGRALGADMIRWATQEGYRAVQFNAVVETNSAAVHLWRSLGFTIVGTVPEAFDHPVHGLVGLHVMHLRLPAAATRPAP